MPILSVTLLLTALSVQTSAAQASGPAAWPLIHLHETSIPLEKIPPAERSLALSLLKPNLGPLFQGESAEQMNQVMRSFRAERIMLAGSPTLVIQPSGNDLCGASGNCSFWIIDLRHRRVVLNAVGIQGFAISPGRQGAMPDIITGSHASATEHELVRWQFQGSSYRRESCADVTSADDDGHPYPTPKITPHPCAIEGN